jgi:NADH-quinone oxidoreductase subunit H
MEALVHNIVEWLDWGPFWGQVVLAVLIVVAAAVVFVVALLTAGVLTWFERRISGRVQSRVGPNRVGPFGLLQWLADGLKLLMKEDCIPDTADRPLFRLAPYPVMIGVFAAFASIPFGMFLVGADLNIGVIYLLAITSLSVVGILMAGWSSNNKWSLLGGIRAAAQIVSYEIPAAMSIFVVVLLAGSFSVQSIILRQGGLPWEWFIFHSPITFVAFFVYFTAAVAEGNRIPFDLPEAESELVAGYNTEYSGIRFAGFFLGEFANVYLMNAIATILFFGGWQVPFVTPEAQAASLWWQLVGTCVFLFKAWTGSLVVLWMRWTLPRLRVDQLMNLCYRYLVPIGFFCLFAVAVYILVFPESSMLRTDKTPIIDWLIHLATAGMGGLVFLVFWMRVLHHARSVGDRFSFLELLQRGKKFEFDPEWQVRRYGAHRKGHKEAR